MPNNIDQYLNTIKTAESGESVRDAVINALKNIHNDTPITNITHGHGIMPERGSRTFEPPAGTVWDSFTADPASGSTQAQVVKELEVNQNDTYEEDNVFYNKVVVNVPQLDKDICQEVFEITENNREYDPMLEGGWDGFGKIKVNISSIPVSGQFTVKFYGQDRTTVIDTQLVPAYGAASCTKLDGTTDSGGRNFKGWNPSPTNVTRDLECYPVYGSYIIDPGEIDETWEQICADGGAHCPIGGYRNLIVSVVAQTDEVLATVKRTNGENNPWVRMIDTTVKVLQPNSLIFNYPYYMVKVAEGEDGTHSTWISTGCATMPNITYYFSNEDGNFQENTDTMVQYSRRGYGNWPYAHCDDWSSCVIRQILNGKIFSSLEPALQQNIKQVTKYTRGLTEHNPNGTRVEIQTLDKIWIPSVKELNTVMSIARIGGAYQPNTYSEIAEIHGIDYASEYVPTWPDGATSGGWWLRSMGYSGGDHNDTTATYVNWNDYGSGPELVINNMSSSASGSYGRIPFGFCL